MEVREQTAILPWLPGEGAVDDEGKQVMRVLAQYGISYGEHLNRQGTEKASEDRRTCLD